jgi:hypothetical protein
LVEIKSVMYFARRHILYFSPVTSTSTLTSVQNTQIIRQTTTLEVGLFHTSMIRRQNNIIIWKWRQGNAFVSIWCQDNVRYRYGEKTKPINPLFQEVNEPALRFFKLITEIQSLYVVISDRQTQRNGWADSLVRWTFLTSCRDMVWCVQSSISFCTQTTCLSDINFKISLQRELKSYLIPRDLAVCFFCLQQIQIQWQELLSALA